MKPIPPRKQLERQARRGFRGYPVGTIAFYGEEGVDYPEGTECPQCPYWHGKDRWAGTEGRG